MNKAQWFSIAGALILFGILYFVLDTKPDTIKASEKSRSLTAEQTSAAVLVKQAKRNLDPTELASLELLEQDYFAAQADSTKLNLGKRLSGRWFELKQIAVAGHYAQLVAEKENSENAWSIAGTTFALCVQRTKEEAEKDFCSRRAVEAFENAISINPAASVHKVNLALVYADHPPKENPMKGIQLLLEMNRSNPEDVQVIKTLARLGIKTGQYDKALARLQKAKTLAPEDSSIDCLMAEIYTATNQEALAMAAKEKCQ